MKKMMTALAAFTLVSTMTACASREDTEAAAEAAGISGEWMANLESGQWEGQVDEYVLADGTFNCLSCDPPYEMTADGEWQEVDRPAIDSRMIEVVDDNTIKAATRFQGEDVGNSTWTVGDDGNSMEIAWTNLRGDEPVSGTSVLTRSEAGPEGSHAVSGKWTPTAIKDMSDAGLRFSFNLDGDTITNSGNGSSYTATLGGEPVAIEGNDAGVMVAVERTGDNSYQETFSRDGEVLSTTVITVDGDTLTAVSTDESDGSVTRWTASRV